MGCGVLRIQKSEEEKKGNYFQLLIDTSTQGPGVVALIQAALPSIQGWLFFFPNTVGVKGASGF